MSQRCFGLPVTLIVVSAFLLLQPAAAEARGCLTASCHQGLVQSRYIHGPVAAEMAGVEGCVMCHLPDGPACTTTMAGKFTLKEKGVCLSCHEKGVGTQHTESKVESECLTCHVPHGSDNGPEMLRDK